MLPHSRACGWGKHEHGVDCHSNCPTCHGKPINYNETELSLIGKAYYAVPRKNGEEQDSRGFNKALDAIWTKYLELANEGS